MSRNCNLKCKPCTRTNEHGNIKLETYIDLLDEYQGIIPWIKLQGIGEPFLHPQIYSLARMAKYKYNYKVMIITNGTILPKINAFDRLIFSIDTIDPDRYNFMRGGDVNLVLHNLRECYKNRFPVEINCVQTKYNTVDDVNNIIELGYLLNIPCNVVP